MLLNLERLYTLESMHYIVSHRTIVVNSSLKPYKLLNWNIQLHMICQNILLLREGKICFAWLNTDECSILSIFFLWCLRLLYSNFSEKKKFDFKSKSQPTRYCFQYSVFIRSFFSIQLYTPALVQVKRKNAWKSFATDLTELLTFSHFLCTFMGMLPVSLST